ncbi:MAG: hypothetical protein E7054_04590 [Lentisphaerae bacterium]|nr:hypothetical protein [Lentisphaerota bacterium]
MKIKFLKKHPDQLTGFGLLALLYIGEAAIRPFAGPHEYEFAALLAEKLPEFPQQEFILRLPAILFTLASGVLFYLLTKRFNFKRPGMAAVFYLLFPPVFYHGTGATLIPVLSSGILLAACGIQGFKFKNRAAALSATIAGAAVSFFYLSSDFCQNADWWTLVTIATVLFIGFIFDRKEKLDKERFMRFINRLILLFAILCGMIAILIWVPVLLRHFKVDFPEGVALYGKHERIIRPMLMLIVTIIWLGLARESKKVGKKLFLCSGALAFFLFFLPVTMPWQIQKDLYWHHTLTPVLKQIDVKNCICLCSKAEAPFFKRFFPKPLMMIGSGKGEIPTAELKTKVENLLKNSDVMIVCNNRQLEKYCPHFAGKRYRTGKFNFYYYYKHGVDKK